MAKQVIKHSSPAAKRKRTAAPKKKFIDVKKKNRNEKKSAAAASKSSKALQAKRAIRKVSAKINKKKSNKTSTAVKMDHFLEKLSSYSGEKGVLIPLLQAAQETYGYIPAIAIDQIHQVVGIPAAEIYGVITFYSQFRLKPLGKYLIKLCDGTACHVNGSERIISAIEDVLQFGGGDTTADGLFTMQKVACLGCCSLSPVIMINDETFGRLTPKKVQQLMKEYKSKAQNAQTA